MNGEENNNYSGDISPEIVNIKPPVTPESTMMLGGSASNMAPNNGMENAGTMGMDSKKSKKWLIPVILGVVVVLLLVGALTYKMFMSSPKRIFESSINSLYKEINNYFNEIEDYSDSYDVLNKAVVFKGDIQIDTDIAEIKEMGINLGDFTLGGEVGIDIKNELMQGSVFLKGKSEKVDLQVYLQDDSIYGGSNLIDGMLKSEYEELSDVFREVRNYLEENKDNSVMVDDYDYIIKTFKDALIENLDSEKMSKEKATISVLDKDVKVTKYSYTIDGHDAQRIIKSINETLLNDDEFVDKLSKLVGEDKEDIKDVLEEMEDSIEEDELDKKASFNIYTSGFANKTTGFSIDYDKEEYFHYYVDGDNFEIYFDDNDDEYSREEIKITGETKDSETEIKVVANDEEVALLNVREFSKELIDFDYEVIDDEEVYTGIVYLSSKEEETSISGDYKFRIEYDGEFISFEGTYGIEVKDELEKVKPDKTISEDEINEEDVQKRLEEIVEKDEAFKKLYDIILEEISQSQLNSYGMISVQSIDELKNVIEQSDKAVIYVGAPNTSVKSTNELEVLNNLKSIQNNYGFTSYYYDYVVLPIEFSQLIDNAVINCITSRYSGDSDVPTNCAPGTNCMPVCLEYPAIYFVKDGKVVSGIRGEIKNSDISEKVIELGYRLKLTLDEKEDI